jgi:hypothetical protein
MRRRTLLGILLAGALALLPAVAYADTEITTANSSEDTDVSSGDSSSHNSGTAQVGHTGGDSVHDGSSSASDAEGADIVNNQADNVQEGDNELEAEQNATSSSGDTVGGQVIGGVVSGNLTVDAANSSEDVDLESGDADSDNNFAAFVGLTSGSSTALGADDDILNNIADNVQAGDNSSDILQNTDATTGDAVGGQVFGGSVTGTVDAVLANTSEDADADSGDADESNDVGQFTGLQANGIIQIV